MSNQNIAKGRSVFEGFNRRDFDAAVAGCSDDFVYTDHATGHVGRGRGGFRRVLVDWAAAFPDGTLAFVRFHDAGDTVTVEMRYEGTNTGPYGPLPATGKRAAMDVCVIWDFNERGEVTTNHAYYDGLGVMQQLGHVGIVGTGPYTG